LDIIFYNFDGIDRALVKLLRKAFLQELEIFISLIFEGVFESCFGFFDVSVVNKFVVYLIVKFFFLLLLIPNIMLQEHSTAPDLRSNQQFLMSFIFEFFFAFIQKCLSKLIVCLIRALNCCVSLKFHDLWHLDWINARLFCLTGYQLRLIGVHDLVVELL